MNVFSWQAQPASRVKQLHEPKEALSARLHRSPDLLDALVMTFTFLEEG